MDNKEALQGLFNRLTAKAAEYYEAAAAETNPAFSASKASLEQAAHDYEMQALGVRLAADALWIRL